jgi:hypothetical protein
MLVFTSVHINETPEVNFKLSEEITSSITDSKYRILGVSMTGRGYIDIFLTTEQAERLRNVIDEALYDESETTKGLKEKIDALESENYRLYEEINSLEHEISLLESRRAI